MSQPPYLPHADPDDDPDFVFPGAVGEDLRALRAQRRQAAIELLVTVAGALLLAAGCALIFLKW